MNSSLDAFRCHHFSANMSKGSKSMNAVEDLWSKFERSESVNTSNINTSSNNNYTVVFIGDSGSGKSTLLQTFLKPSATSKDTKPTIALDYNYARKTVNNSGSNNSSSKLVAHLWEVGGDLTEPRLLEVGLTKTSLSTAAFFLVCDLSRPQNVLNATMRMIQATKEIISKRTAELQATNVHVLNDLRDRISAGFKGHTDAARVKPLDVPIYLVANKTDIARNMPLAERKVIFQILRFLAHYYGAGLVSVSSNDSVSKDNFRALMSAVCFGAAVKNTKEANVEKPVYITRGQDAFSDIFLGGQVDEAMGSKYRVVSSEAELDALISAKGVSRDGWKK